ncbi:MAG: type I-U CRISPR-associated RAMP protein Csb1/Cas7u [Pyrinomonadaceae bacterium]
MTLENIFSTLQNEPRLLIEAELKPVQGSRFQPTGFPDLGAATYKRPDGTSMLLVESAQSMANRLEEVCWNKADDKIEEKLGGLSHVVVDLDNGQMTNSLLEAHRLNSPYIIAQTTNSLIKDKVNEKVGNAESGVLNIRELARTVFKLDAGSVLHGVFLEKIAGRLRLQRLLSAFIEAEGANTVASGGVKLDRIAPSVKDGAKEGYGNVPFARTEFVADKTSAFFNLDLATMRGYGLGEAAEKLLIALSLFKILRFLNTGLRLRTACDFELENLKVTRPKTLSIEDTDALLSEIETQLPGLIQACDFGEQPLQLQGKMPAKKKDKTDDSTPATDESDAD